MVSKVVKVVNAEGLHMRPAGIVAKAAKEHPECEIMMKANGKDIKAKAVMQIMAAGIKKDTEVEIIVTGETSRLFLTSSLKCLRTVSANNSLYLPKKFRQDRSVNCGLSE